MNAILCLFISFSLEQRMGIQTKEVTNRELGKNILSTFYEANK